MRYNEALKLFRNFGPTVSDGRPTEVQVERWWEMAIKQGCTNDLADEAKLTLLNIKYYCLGFAFRGDQVLLIQKDHPAWQMGKLNGIGGVVEPGEKFLYGMVREFTEETGLANETYDWLHRLTISSSEHVLQVFSTNIIDIRDAKSVTPEQVKLVSYTELASMPLIPNLGWMIPFCTDNEIQSPTTIELRR